LLCDGSLNKKRQPRPRTRTLVDELREGGGAWEPELVVLAPPGLGYVPLDAVLALLVSEVGEGDQEDEDDQADRQRHQQGHVVHARVQRRGVLVCRCICGVVEGNEVLVAQVVVSTARDGPWEKVWDQVSFALQQSGFVWGKAAVGPLRDQEVSLRVQHLFHS